MEKPRGYMLNRIAELAIKNGDKTPYAFMKRTGIRQETAYKLYENSREIPSGKALVAICRSYHVQPNDFLVYIESE